MISKGPYLLGLSFLERVLIRRLRASNHTLLPGTNVLGVCSGLIRRCSAFCASDLASRSVLRRSCAAGTASLGVVIDAEGLTPVISSCGVYLVVSCFHEL